LKKRTSSSRNQENSDDSDSDDTCKASSKSKDSDIQCFYCCKRGHKLPDCKLRERAKKIRVQKGDSKKTPKSDATANIAITEGTEPTIADAELWACYTTIPLVPDQDLAFRKAWHLDSGATDHICNDKAAFTDIKRLPKPIQIRIGDNSTVPAVGIGTVQLLASKNRKIQLTGVLYVPTIRTNLLSVSKLTDKGYDVRFSKDGQAIIQKDKSITTAYKKNSMYQVKVSTCFLLASKPTIQSRKRKPRFSIELWHDRLGHLNFTDIRKLSDMATGIRICPEIG
jgi:hypothetical protein